MHHSLFRFRVVLASAALALVAGCASTDIDGADNDVVFPTLRALFDLNDRPGGGEAAPRSRFQHGFEVELSGVTGTMNLDSGIGPTDYQAGHGAALYRFGLNGTRMQIHGLAGIGVDRVDLSDNPLMSNDKSYSGPVVGFEGRLAVRDWLSPYVRLTFHLMEEGSHSQKFETGVAFRTCEAADLLVAYRRWDAEYGNISPTGRDLDVEWRGVVIGFGMRL